MAYDATRKRTVLFGGSRTGPALSETWEWDGKSWTQVKPKTSPPARVDPAMAYDSVRKQVILFGGGGKTLFADTWSWDGKIWTQMKPTVSPPARFSHSMVFDSELQAVVLFGGNPGGAGSPRLSDTWMWNGKTWKQISSKLPPGARVAHMMAYDTLRQETVLFGGLAYPAHLNDTWKLSCYTAASATQYGTGCGSFPGVHLRPEARSLPVLGESFKMQILGLPSTTTAGLMALGRSKTRFGAVALPLDLSSIGMKGCSLYSSFDIQFIFPIQLGLGSFTLPVPYWGQIKGSKAYLQAFGLDRAANAAGLVSSNGLEMVIGYR